MPEYFFRIPRNDVEFKAHLEKVYEESFTDENRNKPIKFSQAWAHYLIGITSELSCIATAKLSKQKEEIQELRDLYGQMLRQRTEMFAHMDELEKRVGDRIESVYEDLTGEQRHDDRQRGPTFLCVVGVFLFRCRARC